MRKQEIDYLIPSSNKCHEGCGRDRVGGGGSSQADLVEPVTPSAFQIAEMFLSSPLCSTLTQRSSCHQHFNNLHFFSCLSHLPLLVRIQVSLLNSCSVVCSSFLLLCMSAFHKLPWAATPAFSDTLLFLLGCHGVWFHT